MSKILVLVFGLLAQVLGLTGDAANPDNWTELGVATLVIWGSVALLRKVITVDGFAVNILAAVVGIAFGVLLGVSGALPGGAFEWVVFGVQATFYATVADMGLKAAAGKSLATPSAG